LDGVSFDVPEGSVFGFLGANGAGKTTLIQLMVGLRKPTRGQIYINGISSILPEARTKVGYLPERPYFYHHLTADRFLRFYGTLSGMEAANLERRISEVLFETGMEQARYKELGTFSKGMLQRIGIAQAILHEPQLLVLDEPMSGLDPVGRKEIRELIQALAKKGTTIFFSTHVIPDIELLCDRVALIQRGKLLECGTIQDLLGKHTSYFELQVRDLPRKQVEAWTGVRVIEDLGLTLKLRLDRLEDAQLALSEISRAKGTLLSMLPSRGSLEDFFGSKRSGGI
jgi:ABC-2 type transport system ATP-binding protein